MKTLVVTDMLQMSQVLGVNLNECDSSTQLDDVDDDFGYCSLDKASAITPELPHHNWNIGTLTQDKLEKLKRGN